MDKKDILIKSTTALSGAVMAIAAASATSRITGQCYLGYHVYKNKKCTRCGKKQK